MSQTKGRSWKRRQAPGPSPDRRNASDTPSAGRRFTPALKSITVGGTVYGHLVAYERERLGLSQEELAARVRTSPATIARIEQGHPPGAELRRRLTETLYTEPQNGLVRRLASSVPHRPSPPPRLALGSRRLWGGVAIAFMVVLLAVIGSRLASGDGAPASQPVVQVSSALGAPAAIHKARVEARKEAAAEARRAARQAREREKAAAAAAASKAEKAAAREQSSSADSQPADSQPAASPVESSPSPSSPPSGGGGSNVPAPDVQHGIGSGGGLSGG
jgi:transcriptional regulator with XRE-family HTH domain